MVKRPANLDDMDMDELLGVIAELEEAGAFDDAHFKGGSPHFWDPDRVSDDARAEYMRDVIRKNTADDGN